MERELVVRGAQVRVVRFKPSPDRSKMGLDDFLVTEGSETLKQLVGQGKPALTWEIEDIAQLPVEDRLQSLKCLFRNLARLDPVELEPYRMLCFTQLGIPRRDFQSQLKRAKEELKWQKC